MVRKPWYGPRLRTVAYQEKIMLREIERALRPFCGMVNEEQIATLILTLVVDGKEIEGQFVDGAFRSDGAVLEGCTAGCIIGARWPGSVEPAPAAPVKDPFAKPSES